jgi:mRNA interferase RelE/StbE
LLRRIRAAVDQVEAAETLDDLPNLTKLSGASGFYRLRVGEYRIGIAVEEDEVEFVRCLHRRDIYRYFP